MLAEDAAGAFRVSQGGLVPVERQVIVQLKNSDVFRFDIPLQSIRVQVLQALAASSMSLTLTCSDSSSHFTKVSQRPAQRKLRQVEWFG